MSLRDIDDPMEFLRELLSYYDIEVDSKNDVLFQHIVYDIDTVKLHFTLPARRREASEHE